MIGEIEQPNGANMADVDEVDFLNDDALLDRMQQAASRFDTFEIPFNRQKVIEAFPDDVRERYVEIRKMYPASL